MVYRGIADRRVVITVESKKTEEMLNSRYSTPQIDRASQHLTRVLGGNVSAIDAIRSQSEGESVLKNSYLSPDFHVVTFAQYGGRRIEIEISRSRPLSRRVLRKIDQVVKREFCHDGEGTVTYKFLRPETFKL